MSSRILVADGRQLPTRDRDRFRREDCVELGPNSGDRNLYSIGYIHSTRRIPSNILELMLPQARKSLTPRFTIDISRSLLDSLDPNLPVYTTGMPFDIKTIHDLREQMSGPGYTTLYSQEVDVDQWIRGVAEHSRAYEKGVRTLAKKSLREIHGAKWLRRVFYQAHQATLESLPLYTSLSIRNA